MRTKILELMKENWIEFMLREADGVIRVAKFVDHFGYGESALELDKLS